MVEGTGRAAGWQHRRRGHVPGSAGGDGPSGGSFRRGRRRRGRARRPRGRRGRPGPVGRADPPGDLRGSGDLSVAAAPGATHASYSHRKPLRGVVVPDARPEGAAPARLAGARRSHRPARARAAHAPPALPRARGRARREGRRGRRGAAARGRRERRGRRRGRRGRRTRGRPRPPGRRDRRVAPPRGRRGRGRRRTPPGAAPTEFTRAVLAGATGGREADAVDDLLHLYHRARFGRRPLPPDAGERAARALDRVAAALPRTRTAARGEAHGEAHGEEGRQ